MQKRLERFLSWLLDARWFPETNLEEKKQLKSELRMVRRITARMEAFNKEHRDVRLKQGLELWRSYQSTVASLAKTQTRTAPHLSASSMAKGSPEIAQRLMCAVLVIRKLYPQVSAYEKAQELLADPSQLPYPITVSEETIQELRAGTLRRPVTASELNYLRDGQDIPMRPYWRSLKALESSVARLEKELTADKHSSQLAILHNLYAEYLWSQKFQAGFSNDEAAMLNALVSTDVPAVEGVLKGPPA